MNLSDCPKCRVGSVWNTGVCPVCPAPRMAQECVSELRATEYLSKRRQRFLDRLWRSSASRGATVHYAGLAGKDPNYLYVANPESQDVDMWREPWDVRRRGR